MKILKEIEKSRLSEESMLELQGGAGIAENCSDKVTYRSCGNIGSEIYNVQSCYSKLTCPAQYYVCDGPTNYTQCTTPTHEMYIHKWE